MNLMWHTTMPAGFQEDGQEASEGEYMAALIVRTDSARSSVAVNGTTVEAKEATKIDNDEKPPGMTIRQAPTKSRKRKAAEATATDKTAAKKAKKSPIKTEDAESTESPVPNKTKKRSIKTEDAEAGNAPPSKRRKACKGPKETESFHMPPPPLPPAKVSKPVASKIAQVHDYINTHPELSLDRNADDDTEQTDNIITIPELDLACILRTMHRHYELTTSPGHVLVDIEDAIVKRSEQAIGTAWVLTNVAELSVARMTKLEGKIHAKIIRHGLGDKNLLKIEIGMFKERASHRAGLWRPAVHNLLAAVADATSESETETDGEAVAEEQKDPQGTSTSVPHIFETTE